MTTSKEDEYDYDGDLATSPGGGKSAPIILSGETRQDCPPRSSYSSFAKNDKAQQRKDRYQESVYNKSKAGTPLLFQREPERIAFKKLLRMFGEQALFSKQGTTQKQRKQERRRDRESLSPSHDPRLLQLLKEARKAQKKLIQTNQQSVTKLREEHKQETSHLKRDHVKTSGVLLLNLNDERKEKKKLRDLNNKLTAGINALKYSLDSGLLQRDIALWQQLTTSEKEKDKHGTARSQDNKIHNDINIKRVHQMKASSTGNLNDDLRPNDIETNAIHNENPLPIMENVKADYNARERALMEQQELLVKQYWKLVTENMSLKAERNSLVSSTGTLAVQRGNIAVQQKKIDSLELEKSNLEEELSRVSAEKTTQLNSITETTAFLNDRLEKAQRHNVVLEEKIRSLELGGDNADVRVERAVQDNERLGQRLSTLEKEKIDAEDELSKTQELNHSYEKKRIELQIEFTKVQEEKKIAIQKLQGASAKTIELEALNLSNERKLAEFQVEFEKVQEERAKQRSSIVSTTNSLNVANNELEITQKENLALIEKIAQLESETLDKENQLSAALRFKDRAFVLETEMTKLAGEKLQIETEYKSKSQSFSKVTENLRTIQYELADVVKENESLVERVSVLESQKMDSEKKVLDTHMRNQRTKKELFESKAETRKAMEEKLACLKQIEEESSRSSELERIVSSLEEKSTSSNDAMTTLYAQKEEGLKTGHKMTLASYTESINTVLQTQRDESILKGKQMEETMLSLQGENQSLKGLATKLSAENESKQKFITITEDLCNKATQQVEALNQKVAFLESEKASTEKRLSRTLLLEENILLLNSDVANLVEDKSKLEGEVKSSKYEFSRVVQENEALHQKVSEIVKEITDTKKKLSEAIELNRVAESGLTKIKPSVSELQVGKEVSHNQLETLSPKARENERTVSKDGQEAGFETAELHRSPKDDKHDSCSLSSFEDEAPTDTTGHQEVETPRIDIFEAEQRIEFPPSHPGDNERSFSPLLEESMQEAQTGDLGAMEREREALLEGVGDHQYLGDDDLSQVYIETTSAMDLIAREIQQEERQDGSSFDAQNMDELRDLVQFLEYDRAEVARITNVVLELERESHKEHLKAAVTTATRESMDELRLYQEHTSHQINCLYRALCKDCRKRIDTAS